MFGGGAPGSRIGGDGNFNLDWALANIRRLSINTEDPRRSRRSMENVLRNSLRRNKISIVVVIKPAIFVFTQLQPVY